ncbi:MAG: flagellar filament capping protein FliD [Lachnospiraceae bacterium]|nr:flagellar filament capping protein FliD [Lachnospiraceae bacterium]
MAGVRMTGMISGLDTETLVSQLSEAYQTKVDDVKKQQTKAEWKKEAWASLNTKIMDFYKGALSTFKSVSTYRTKTATGDLKGVKVTAGSNSVNGTHRVKVLSTATAQMWTGRKLNNGTYESTSYTAVKDNTRKLSSLTDNQGNSVESQIRNMKFTVKDESGKEYKVDLTDQLGADATVEDAVNLINQQLDGSGVKVEFAAGNFRMSNETAVSSETENADGEKVTTFTGGQNVTITAEDETTAKILGVTTDAAGTKLEPRTSDPDKEPVYTIGGSTKFYEEVRTAGAAVTGSSKLIDLGIAEGTEIKVNGHAITVDRTTTLNGLATSMAKLGIEASYDAGQGRFYLNSKATGADNQFTLEAVNADGSTSDALHTLGLDLQEGDEGRIDAKNAEIEYNGVKYSQASNTFSINGLTIEATEEGGTQTFSVGTDSKGIYDKVKSFVKSYNDLIGEMNTLYSAARVKDYEPLTDDEKKAMSDDEVEKWEGVIKASLLRRDDTINSLTSSMRSTLSKSVAVTMSDGTTKNFALSSFGINTGVYTEKGKLHIYGDSDDADYADYDDALMKAINENPDAVEKTFSTLGSEIYNNLMKAMSSNKELSSALTFYNDKQMDTEIQDYKDKVSDLQDKLQDEQDRYYDQFSKMESAMAKLQAQQTYISQLFSG